MTLKLKDSRLFKTQAYIDGQWVSGYQGATFNVVNPANGETVAQVADMGAEDARDAVAAAERAGQTWRKVSVKERARLLKRWFDLVMEETEALARIMTIEQGKPLAEARGEVLSLIHI